MASAEHKLPRQALSVRTRFEVFKRDGFVCQYCGRRSPEVVLEVDHIVPVCSGGSDDEINLLTACWECNRGKAGVPLSSLLTGEDPHDKAIELQERMRQLEEYNNAIGCEREQREEQSWALWRYWQIERGNTKQEELDSAPRSEIGWIRNSLLYCPSEQIKTFMDMAIDRFAWKNLRYVKACVRNWRYEHQAEKDMTGEDF